MRGISFHVFASFTSRAIPTCFWYRFCIDFSPPKSFPKCIKKPFKKDIKFQIDFPSILDGFGPPFWFPFSTKIDKNGTTELKGSTFFFHLRFLGASWGYPRPPFFSIWVPPGSDFYDIFMAIVDLWRPRTLFGLAKHMFSGNLEAHLLSHFIAY